MPAYTAPKRRLRQPQAARATIVSALIGSTMEDPGLRLAGTTARSSRVFSGTCNGIQTFVRPASPNDPGTLDSMPTAVNQRRALNRMRGLGMTR